MSETHFTENDSARVHSQVKEGLDVTFMESSVYIEKPGRIEVVLPFEMNPAKPVQVTVYLQSLTPFSINFKLKRICRNDSIPPVTIEETIRGWENQCPLEERLSTALALTLILETDATREL